MITSLCLSAIVLTALVGGVDADFLSRVENTKWLDSQGKPIPRIGRDADGNVEKLQLDGIQLTPEDFAAIGRLRALRFLGLQRTNVTDADVRKLRELPHLQGLSLTNTEITDASIDEIMKFESLRSLCLGNVAVTPEAVARLKAHSRTQEDSSHWAIPGEGSFGERNIRLRRDQCV